MEDAHSSTLRMAAFAALGELRAIHGDTMRLDTLAEGFRVGNETVLFMSRPRGIFKPRQIRKYPLSFKTVSDGPYEDSFAPDSVQIRYKYQGDDPQARDNRMMRAAMQDRIPLIYFFSTLAGHYFPIWPVFIVGDDPSTLTFTVAVDDHVPTENEVNDVEDDLRRGYVTGQTRQRIHQRAFRDRVLDAYRERCCVCKLNHPSLLDAAHIVADADPEGEPIVRNGLALCKLHHTAYDRSFFGVRPDYKIEVSQAILEENDGPILEHGLKRIHGQKIATPKRAENQPEPWRLEKRFETFRQSVAAK